MYYTYIANTLQDIKEKRVQKDSSFNGYSTAVKYAKKKALQLSNEKHSPMVIVCYVNNDRDTAFRPFHPKEVCFFVHGTTNHEKIRNHEKVSTLQSVQDFISCLNKEMTAPDGKYIEMLDINDNNGVNIKYNESTRWFNYSLNQIRMGFETAGLYLDRLITQCESIAGRGVAKITCEDLDSKRNQVWVHTSAEKEDAYIKVGVWL